MRASSKTIAAVSLARMPCLISVLVDFDAGSPGFDHERAHPGTSRAAVDRRPNDDQPIQLVQRQLAVGAENLLAVEHPLVGGLVKHRAGADRRRIRSRARFGHRHRTPRRGIALREARQELDLLLRRADRLNRRAAERATGQTQVNPGVAPRQHLDHQHQPQIGRPRALLAAARFGICQFIERLLLHVTHDGPHLLDELGRALVLVLIQFARDRAHGVLRRHFAPSRSAAEYVREFQN